MTTISKNRTEINPNVHKLVSKYVQKLEDEKVQEKSLVDEILEDIQSLTEKEKKQYLTSIEALILHSNVKGENRITLNLVSRILSSIVFWEYACEHNGMSMAFDEELKKSMWKKLSKISDLKQKDILEIVNQWNKL